jgi:hypothetical protein
LTCGSSVSRISSTGTTPVIPYVSRSAIDIAAFRIIADL